MSRLPLTIKVLLLYLSLSLVVSFTGSYILYRGASRSLRQEVRKRLIMVAATAARQIDPKLHRRIQSVADESTPEYRKLKSILINIRKANPDVRYVYTMRKTARHNVWEFVVDAERDPKRMSHVGDLYNVSEYPEMQLAFVSPNADKQPNADKWGTWLSGYAPIKEPNGRTEAIIGLDMSVNRLYAEESGLRRAMAKNVLVALLLGLVLSLFFTRSLLKSVYAFITAAERVRRGDLSFEVNAAGSQEMARFADEFNSMLADLKSNRERLMGQATLDYTTGLCNHIQFQERLTSELERAERYERNLSLILLDIDDFKTVNDTFGREIGDSILRQLAQVIRGKVRSIDVAARFGGDEIAIILPETDSEIGMVVARKLLSAIQCHMFYAVPISELPEEKHSSMMWKDVELTVTMGLAGYPNHHRTRDGLMMAAEIALCRAKHLSRNNVCSYDETLGQTEPVDPQDLYNVLRHPDLTAVRSLAAAIDAKDQYTRGHSGRVAGYALQIGQALGLNRSTLESLKIAGLMHDLGKIGIPDLIINRPGKLTPEEFSIIQRHPSMGEEILRGAPELKSIVPAVLFHHERWDGSGYPQGLRGEEIPMIARILAVADAYDAMTSDRPYREALPSEQALQELEASKGGQFDPAIAEAFISIQNDAAREQAA